MVQTASVPTAHVNGIDLHYVVEGSGPRVLLFNGSGATVESAAPMLSALTPHFEVLLHDQRCLGLSTVTDAVPTMADYAADGAALLDHLGWESVRVFGISFGGMVAQEFAVTWPERVTRLALMCTSPGGAGGSSFPLHTIEAMEPAEQERLRLHLMDLRYTDEFLAVNPFDRMLVDMAAAARATPKDERTVRGERLQLQGRAGHDVWDRLPRISCPVLVASGEFDALAPPDNGRSIASRVQFGEFRSFVGGHGFLWQDRTAWPSVVEWLRTEGDALSR